MEKLTNVRYQLIPVSALSVDIYQRGIEPLRIKKMVTNFDAALLGSIIVSERDGKYYVIDGQHRVILCKKVGVTSLMAIVLEGLTLEEEAKYFNHYNGAKGERKSLHKENIFNANVIAKDEASLQIKQIVESVGLRFGRGQGHNTIAAYNTVYKIFESYGKEHFARTINLIAATWNGESYSLNNYMLTAVSEFIKVYGADPLFSDHKFIKQLSRVEPLVVVREMKADVTTPLTKIKGLNVLIRHFNKGLIKKLENQHFNMR